MICSNCAEKLTPEHLYCPICKTRVDEVPRNLSSDAKPTSVTPAKRRLFYGTWIFVNVIFVLSLFNSATAPVDRFRNLCVTEGLNCAPSSQDQMANAIGNLIIWNLIFWGFRLWHRKKRRA